VRCVSIHLGVQWTRRWYSHIVQGQKEFENFEVECATKSSYKCQVNFICHHPCTAMEVNWLHPIPMLGNLIRDWWDYQAGGVVIWQRARVTVDLEILLSNFRSQ
jgi:hypothetical protein